MTRPLAPMTEAEARSALKKAFPWATRIVIGNDGHGLLGAPPWRVSVWGQRRGRLEYVTVAAYGRTLRAAVSAAIKAWDRCAERKGARK